VRADNPDALTVEPSAREDALERPLPASSRVDDITDRLVTAIAID